MENKKKYSEKLNINKLNDLFNTGSKILKLLYFILVLLIIYVLSLVIKEWGLLKFLLTILKVISPLFYGVIIAWLLNPFVKKLENRGMGKALAVVLVYLLLFIFIYLFSLALLPSLADQINDIVSSIPAILSDIKTWAEDLFVKISDKSLINLDNVKNELFISVEKFGTELTTNLPNLVIGLISGLVSGIGTILLSFIVGFYMSFNISGLKNHVINILPKRMKSDTERLMGLMSGTLLEYVKGTLLISFILFVVSYIGFTIIGLKAPALFALFCAITNLIPYIGPYIGGAAAVLVGFTQSNFIGIVIIIFIIICQSLESYILQPVVMSKKVNVHPVTILISLLIFGYFFGIIGMILATPIVALIKVIYVFLDEKYGFFEYKEEKKTNIDIRKLVK